MSDKSLLVVSSPPHLRSSRNTRSIMLDVILALTPALAISVYFFGWRAVAVTLLSVASCVLFELLIQSIRKIPIRISDLSAVVTGILLAYNLPVTIPYWMVIAGAFFAIVIVKELFGGIGSNFMNPALAARVFLTISWPAAMSTWVEPLQPIRVPILGLKAADIMTAATPLSYLKQGLLPPQDFSLLDMGLGSIGGCLGEVSAFLLIGGGIYLLLLGVISPRIPVSFLGTVALLTYLFPKGNEPVEWMLYHLLSGGLVLGALFMATDYVTSPISRRGQIIFGIGCGLLTVLLRYYGTYPEGASFAILIMNALVWMLDKSLKPRRYGTPLIKLPEFFKKPGDKAGKSKAGDQN